MAKILEHQPLHKKELRYYKTKRATDKHHAKKAPATAAREEAEARMADAIQQAVQMLEFNMIDLMQHPIGKSHYRTAVNQAATINVIRDLKTKCGVTFASDEFTQRVPLAVPQPARTVEQARADQEFQKMTSAVHRKDRERRAAEMERREKEMRREERLKTMREAAQRLEARKAAATKKLNEEAP
jgi:hypothetical protein